MCTPTSPAQLRKAIEVQVAKFHGTADIARIVFDALRLAKADWRETSLETVKDLTLAAVRATRPTVRNASPPAATWSGTSPRLRGALMCGTDRR